MPMKLIEKDLASLAQIKVLNPDGTTKEVVVVEHADGEIADYSGYSRHQAFRSVFGRKPTKQEVIDQTVLFCPRFVSMPINYKESNK